MSAASPQVVPTRVVAAAVVGSALEFYDFVIYAFFAVYIGAAFFPASTPFASLLLSLAVFGVGFIARPLGSLVIGDFADRVGRKPAMLLTMVLITLGTLGLALTPTYDSIGLAAPVIVVLCRVMQGLALGGEVGPASAFLLESAPTHRRAYYASWQLASQGAAGLLAGFVGLCVSMALSPTQMQAWGWRLPFFFGLLLVPLALYLRRAMPETLDRAATAGQKTGWRGLRPHRRLLVLGVLVVAGGTVSTYVLSFMTTYAITTLKLGAPTAMAATAAVGVSTLVFALLAGTLCDRKNRRTMMLWPRLGIALLSVPAFAWLIAQPGPASLLLVSFGLAALNAMSGAASLVVVLELLPSGVRAMGLSITYAVGVALFGGSTQLLVTWLIGFTGSPLAPAWYLAATSLVAAFAAWALPESSGPAQQA